MKCLYITIRKLREQKGSGNFVKVISLSISTVLGLLAGLPNAEADFIALNAEYVKKRTRGLWQQNVAYYKPYLIQNKKSFVETTKALVDRN